MAVSCQGVMGRCPRISLSWFSLEFFSEIIWPLVARELWGVFPPKDLP